MKLWLKKQEFSVEEMRAVIKRIDDGDELGDFFEQNRDKLRNLLWDVVISVEQRAKRHKIIRNKDEAKEYLDSDISWGRPAEFWAVAHLKRYSGTKMTAENLWVVKVHEDVGHSGEVTRVADGMKLVAIGLVQRYRSQARALKKEYMAENNIRVACSYADQYGYDDWGY